MDDRIKLYKQLLLEIQAEVRNRTNEHKQRVDAIKKGIEHRKLMNLVTPNQPLDFLAIGDSWFDYPLNGNDYSPFVHTDIVAQLSHLENPSPKILNYALHGQATTAMLSYENQQQMIEVLSTRSSG